MSSTTTCRSKERWLSSETHSLLAVFSAARSSSAVIVVNLLSMRAMRSSVRESASSALSMYLCMRDGGSKHRATQRHTRAETRKVHVLAASAGVEYDLCLSLLTQGGIIHTCFLRGEGKQLTSLLLGSVVAASLCCCCSRSITMLRNDPACRVVTPLLLVVIVQVIRVWSLHLCIRIHKCEHTVSFKSKRARRSF